MAFNAIQFCKDYGIQYSLSGKNVSIGWVGVQCPFCSDESNHGGINPKNGYYSCWKCGANDMAKYIQIITGKTLKEAIKIKYNYNSESIFIYNKKEKGNVGRIILPGEELQKIHIKYLRKRRFNPDYLIEKYGIKGTGITGKYRYRIIIPIYHNGILISFTGRDVTGKQREKYLTLSASESIINPKHILYGLEYCKNKRLICVVEGVFDVWRMGDGFCASLGVSLTEQQIKLLLSYNHIILMFDPEKEAYKKAKKVAENIAGYGNEVEIIKMEKGKDPGALSEDVAILLRKELGFD